MARILIGGAGGAPSNNFIMSLRASGGGDHLIGMCSVPSDLFLADVDERFVVPNASDPAYMDRLVDIVRQSGAEFIHVQHDFEVRRISRDRRRLDQMGLRYFLPAHETVEVCVDKSKSYDIWKKSGIPVPETVLIDNPETLRASFRDFGGKIWLRATEGAAGRGALPTDSYDFAALWIERFNGWGAFTAAECLTARTVTWMSIWYEGELVVAQTRRRRSWSFGDRTLSGVTGITHVGETCSDPAVDEIALSAIRAIDPRPHAIFSVDLTYDERGRPNPTEINIGRFFTTHYFFTKAGVNFPKIYRDIALEGRFPNLPKRVNPLPDGLLWIRGMDVAPVLISAAELERLERAR
jgi:hypothetical protein